MSSNKKMRLITTCMLVFSAGLIYACPVCERNQPRLLKGIVHGSGPDSQWDYVIMWVVIAITILSLYYAVKWLIRPGEQNVNHVKYSIINQE